MSFDSIWNYVNSATTASSVTNAVGYITLGNDGQIKFGGSYTSDLNSIQQSAINSGGFSKIFAGGYGMYAAQKENGSLVIFGYTTNNSSDELTVINKLLNSVVTDVRFNYGAGAAKLSDGTVVTWGHNGYESEAAKLLTSPATSSSSGQFQIPFVPEIYISSEPNSKIDAISINEGLNFYVSVFNINSSSYYPWTISGVSNSDISGGQLNGTSFGNGGTQIGNAFLVIADNLTEGEETLTFTIAGLSKSIKINDTSKSATPTYSLQSEKGSSANEGTTATFTLTTTNVASGISVPYTLSGISSADVSGGSLSGNAVVNSSGVATISVSLLKDSLTEGSETLTVTAGGATASIIVNDISLTPTYFLTTGVNNVAEGNTVTFSLQTTNVSSGTALPYQISGVSAADIVGGNLTGSVLVSSPYSNESSSGNISIQLAADLLTEGRESLTVTVGNSSSTVAVEDTSVTPVYEIYAGNGSYNEGQTAEFVFTAKNVSAFTSLTYAISGVSSSDIDNGKLSGSIQFSSGPYGYTFYLPLANDGLSEGDETLTVSIGGVSASAVIKDTSKAAATPTYSLVASNASINEGSTANFILTTTNVASGASVPYTLTGISAADVPGGVLSGSAVVNSSGVATIAVTLVNDSLTEGSETLTVSAGGTTASTIVNDTSRAAALASYSLTASNSSVNEGATATFTLTTTNVAAGTTVPYTLSNISAADVSGGSLSGTTTVASNGQATISVLLTNDNLTEGTETLTITAGGASASTQINDTSKAASATYAVSTNWTSTTEGTPITVTLATTNVSAGTTLYYHLSGSGITTSDFGGLSLTGSSVINSSGQATLNIPLSADLTTEGDETFLIQYYTDPGRSFNTGSGAYVTILDTSKGVVTPTNYRLTSDFTSADEGTQVVATLGSTNNFTAGTVLYYSIYGTGITSSDIGGLALNGSGVLDGFGRVVLSIPLAKDLTTEGSETLFIQFYTDAGRTAQAGNAESIFIYDTSTAVAKPTYILFADAASFNEGSIASFNLTTTNIPAGSTLTYTIEGVSSEDIVGGAISGTLTLNANGFAAIQIPVANDSKTEGTETLTIRIAEAIARTFIYDTSVTANTTLTSIPYGYGQFYFSTLAADKVTGTAFVDVIRQSSSLATNQLTKLSDGSWQVQNKFTPSNSDNLVNVERIEFNDFSVALDVSGPAGQVAKILGSVFGKSYVNNTEFAGIGFAYLDGGMSYLDLCGLAAGAAGLTTPDLLVTTLLRNTTGTEPTALSKSSYLQSISNGSSYASVVQQIADSSANAQSIKLTDIANTGLVFKPYVFPPTYSLSASAASVNEGTTAVFNLTTTNVAVGTEVSYTLSGISSSDLMSGTLNGKVTIGAGGVASINVPIASDGATEGQESLTISAQGANASIAINDTSKSIALPTYTLTPATLSVNEGELARVYVNTTNVAAGTALQYGISGLSANDLIGDMTRLVNVDSLGQAFINIQILADQTTEGPETMYITLGTSTTSFIINDTSITLVGVIDNGGSGDGGGGGGGGGGD